MAPTKLLMTEDTMKKRTFKGTKKNENAKTITSQLWHRSGSCPKGTIPVRRIQKHLQNKKEVHDYGRKKPSEPMNETIKTMEASNSLANHSVCY